MPIVNKSFSDIITFTRASGGGRFNAQGQYEWLPANTPRIDYDPVTGECLGLLVEEQRTNLLTYSSDFANAAWSKARATINVQSIVTPDGSIGAPLVVPDAVGGSHQLNAAAVSAKGGTAYTLSVFAKAGGYRHIRLRAGGSGGFLGDLIVDLIDGMIKQGPSDASIQKLNDGWYRISATFTTTASDTFFAWGIWIYNNGGSRGEAEYVGDGTSGIYVWGAQLEEGAFPTSYIPTTNAQVTRAADIASVNELSPWYNPEQGTLFVEASTFVPPTPGVVAIFYAALQDGASNVMGIYRSSLLPGQTGLWVVKDGVQVIDSPNGVAVPANTVAKAAMTYDATAVRTVFNGSGGPSASTAPPVPTQLNIGGRQGASRCLNGHIRSLRYFPRAMPDQLQALTA